MLRESRLTTGICSSRIEIMGFCQKTRKEANHPMKHQLLALLLGSLLLLGLPAACADTPTMTVLMYMCGTDLQSDCVNDLYEMCAADIPDNVTVVVQAGGASQWDDSRLPCRTTSTALRLRTTIFPTLKSAHGKAWARRTRWRIT